jgi:choline dehydrogenase-like flavoprotein
MIQDFRQALNGAAIETDICIIGAGAAGITLARALGGSGRRICLVESGGFEPEPETLALNKGKVVGLPYASLDQVRLRYFGGSTNHWNSYCRPLDAIDFEKRSWVPHSGWPIDRATLDPFYPEAQKICELGPYAYDNDAVVRTIPGIVDFNRDRVENVHWMIGPPTRFGQRYLEDLEQAPNVDILLNANVVEVVAAQDAQSVAALKLMSLDRKTGIIRPKLVVLACGGIENARLLLASNSVVSAGLGNGRDLVGRFFADHVGAIMGYVVPDGSAACKLGYNTATETKIDGDDALIRLAAALPAKVQRREKLLNCHAMLDCADELSPGYLALRQAGKKVARGEVDGIGEAVLTILEDLGGTAGGMWRFLNDELVMGVDVYGEMVPSPESRITLDSERDRLGMPQVRLDWKLSPLDKRTARFLCRQLGEELARLDFGRLHISEWLLQDDTNWERLHPWSHQMGTTRMSADPASGVVDANCRVHGMHNLYVAGSSVFPTYGAAPPTLTIVALALRLAEHLRQVDLTLHTSTPK